MKFTAIILIAAASFVSAFGQTKKKPPVASHPRPVASRTPPKTAPATSKSPAMPRNDRAEFDAASLAADNVEKVIALKKFLVDFPKSEYVVKARELLVAARAIVADEKLRSGDVEASISLFKLAVQEAPEPIPQRLFSEVVSKFPYSLYWNGQRSAALDVASAIEFRAVTDAGQLIALANFYANIENGAEAMRVAEAALKLDPNSSPAYQTIGLAHRLNFELEKSAAAYAKALELDPESLNAKQSLAEMRRALGKAEEAEKLYSEILATAPDDIPARTGFVLSLFDGGKKDSAEAEMAKALEMNAKNVILLAGAAYWYASSGNSDRAIELAEKAIELEPRYIWSHIALARGYLGKHRPVDAERVLTRARSYGNFPTVEYELATARMEAGFYREAAEDLRKAFAVVDGGVSTRLGGRVERTATGFADLTAAERRASIFASSAATDDERDLKLRQLLALHQLIAEPSSADAVGVAVDEFTSGSDPMKVHRQLYAASLLLDKNVEHDKVLELARAATGNIDAALDAPKAGAAIMASELYDSRSLAFARNEFLLVPDIPRQTLSLILRGRVEDVAGWALYQKSNYPEAIVRLRRAVSVLPDKSAWWRASTWRLGAALAASGKEQDALEAYIASYKTDKPDLAKYAVVESLYKRVHKGSVDGLEEAIGKDRVVTLAAYAEPVSSAVVTESKSVELQPELARVTEPAPVTTHPANLPRAVPVDPASALNQVEHASTVPSSDPAIGSATSSTTETEPGADNSAAAPTNKVQSSVLAPVAPPTPVPPPGVPADKQASEFVNKEETAKQVAPSEPSKSTESPVAETKAEPMAEKPPLDTAAVEPEPGKPAAGQAAPSGEKPKGEPFPSPVSSLPAAKPTEALKEPDVVPEPADTSSRVAGPPDEKTTGTRSPESIVKPLFEPVIITIPNSRPAKRSTEAMTTGAARPRVVEGVEVRAEEIPACKIDISQENVSLINSGGTIGLLVSVDDELAARQLTATSNSPTDVEIKAEPEIGDQPSKQRLYIAKSVSPNPGVYKIRFAAGCGKKDVIVAVR